jgi:hypothetical protein
MTDEITKNCIAHSDSNGLAKRTRYLEPILKPVVILSEAKNLPSITEILRYAQDDGYGY